MGRPAEKNLMARLITNLRRRLLLAFQMVLNLETPVNTEMLDFVNPADANIYSILIHSWRQPIKWDKNSSAKYFFFTFQMGHSRPLFFIFVVYKCNSKHMLCVNFWRWLDSNSGVGNNHSANWPTTSSQMFESETRFSGFHIYTQSRGFESRPETEGKMRVVGR